MPETEDPLDIENEWNLEEDTDNAKLYVDGEDPVRDWSVSFRKVNGSWMYSLAPPRTKPDGEMTTDVFGSESLLELMADAEAVVADRRAE